MKAATDIDWYKAVALHQDVTWSGAERLARLDGGYLSTIMLRFRIFFSP